MLLTQSIEAQQVGSRLVAVGELEPTLTIANLFEARRIVAAFEIADLLLDGGEQLSPFEDPTPQELMQDVIFPADSYSGPAGERRVSTSYFDRDVPLGPDPSATILYTFEALTALLSSRGGVENIFQRRGSLFIAGAEAAALLAEEALQANEAAGGAIEGLLEYGSEAAARTAGALGPLVVKTNFCGTPRPGASVIVSATVPSGQSTLAPRDERLLQAHS